MTLISLRSLRWTGRAFVAWSAIIMALLVARLPFEHWSQQCTSPPGLSGLVTTCTKADAPTTLLFAVFAWLVGVAVIGLVRYVPLPTPKR